MYLCNCFVCSHDDMNSVLALIVLFDQGQLEVAGIRKSATCPNVSGHIKRAG